LLKTERDGLQAQTAALKDQVVTLKGVPAFLATALLALFTADDMTHIVSAIAAPDARTLYFELQQRAVTGDKPIPIDSQTFLAGLAVLKTALGEQRVAALFAALNIDLVAGRYINP